MTEYPLCSPTSRVTAIAAKATEKTAIVEKTVRLAALSSAALCTTLIDPLSQDSPTGTMKDF